MEYIYAVMLLNKAGKEINEKNVDAVLKAAGVEVDSAKVKSLVSALEGVNVEEVIASASVVSAAPAQASTPSSGASEAPKKEEKKEEAPVADAAAGLGSLF